MLSVGDATFQDRSLRRMLEFRDGRQAAIVFVSHNLSAVELMCPRAIWLDRGHVRAHGPTSDVLRDYLDSVDSDADQAEGGYLHVDSIEVVNNKAEELFGYIWALADQTRRSPSLALGVSPRGAAMLLSVAKAWAYLSGRGFVTPDDVKALVKPAWRHRVVLRPEVEMEGATTDAVLDGVVERVPVPK